MKRRRGRRAGRSGPSAYGRSWRMFDRLTAWLPAARDDRKPPSVVPNPQEHGIGTEEHEARWRLWRHRLGKEGKGGYR